MHIAVLKSGSEARRVKRMHSDRSIQYERLELKSKSLKNRMKYIAHHLVLIGPVLGGLLRELQSQRSRLVNPNPTLTEEDGLRLQAKAVGLVCGEKAEVGVERAAAGRFA